MTSVTQRLRGAPASGADELRAGLAAVRRRVDGWTVAVVALGFAALLALGQLLIARLAPTGDEPWYLLQVYALIHWHTPDLAPALRDHQLYASFLHGAPDDHTRDYLNDGERVLVNLPGYALAIAPAYALGGRVLVVAFQSLLAALTGGLVFVQVRHAFGSRAVALLAWLAYLAPLPVLLYVGQIFPSTIAAFLLFLGYVLVSSWLPVARDLQLPLLGAATGAVVFALPWVHIKYAPTALLLAALALVVLHPRLRLRPVTREDRLAWYAAGIVGALTAATFVLIAAYSRHYFGTWTPPNAEQQPDLLHPGLGNVLDVYADMFLSPQSGLLPWVPLDLLVPLGLVLLLRRAPRQGRFLLAILAVQLGSFVAAAVTPVFQGKALPARFTVECAPFFACCLAAVFAAGLPWLRAALVTPAAGRLRRVRAWLAAWRGAAHRWSRAAGGGTSADGRPLGARRFALDRGAAARVVLRAAAALALALLAITVWFSAMGERDPENLYPSPAGPRLVDEYADLLPGPWFALFPSLPRQWVTRGTAALESRWLRGRPIPGPDGARGLLMLPGRLAPGARLALSDPVLMPPGAYVARFVLACRPATHREAPVGRLVVRRGWREHGRPFASRSIPTVACDGIAHPSRVELPFTSNGFQPLTFEVRFGGDTQIVAWSVEYAPLGP